MINNKLFIFFLIITFSCTEQNSKTNKLTSSESIVNDSCNIPEILKNIPIGISVINEPDTIYAELNPKPESKYIWKHTTTIISTKYDLQIIEFGTYNFRKGKWILGNYTKKPFTTENFDKWYCLIKNGLITFDFCKNGKIIKGQEYIDASNYSIRNDSLVNRNGLWYYIGVNSTGKKFMGYGRYVVINKLKAN